MRQRFNDKFYKFPTQIESTAIKKVNQYITIRASIRTDMAFAPVRHTVRLNLIFK